MLDTHVKGEAESVWPLLGGIAIIAALSWCYFGSPFGTGPAANELVHPAVASPVDAALAAYQRSTEQGRRTDICTSARVVTNAYLREEDDQHYMQWKARQQHDCAAAGVTIEG